MESTPTFEHPQPQSNQPAFGQVANSAPNTNELVGNIADINNKIEQLQNKRTNFNTDIIGLYETVSVAPTGVPTSPYEQIKIYVNGATLRFYWYDSVAHVWHYVTATA